MRADDCNKITTFEIENKFEEASTHLAFLRNYLIAFERAWNVDTTYYRTMIESLKSELDGLGIEFKSIDVVWDNNKQTYEQWGGG